MAAVIQTQKAIDRLQRVFVDLPRIVSTIAKDDNLSTDEAINAFVERVFARIKTIADARHVDLNDALQSVKSLEAEVRFVKNLYATDVKNVAQLNTLVEERAKHIETIQQLKDDLALMQSQMNQYKNGTPEMQIRINQYIARIAAAESNLDKLRHQYEQSEHTASVLTNNLASVTTQNEYERQINANVVSKFKTMLTTIYPNDNTQINTISDVYAKFVKLIDYLNTMGVVTDDIIGQTSNFKNDELVSAKTTIASLKVERSNRDQEIRRLRTQVETLQQDGEYYVQNTNAQMEQYKNEIKQLTQDNIKLKSDTEIAVNMAIDEDESVLNATNRQLDTAQATIRQNEQEINRLQLTIDTLKADEQQYREQQQRGIEQLNFEINRSKLETTQLTSQITNLELTSRVMQEKLTALKNLFESYSKRINGNTIEVSAITELMGLIDDQSPNIIENFKALIDKLAATGTFSSSSNSSSNSIDNMQLTYNNSSISNFDSDYRPITPGRTLATQDNTEPPNDSDDDNTLTSESAFILEGDQDTSKAKIYENTTTTVTASEIDDDKTRTITQTVTQSTSVQYPEPIVSNDDFTNDAIVPEIAPQNSYINKLDLEQITDVSASSSMQPDKRITFAGILDETNLVNSLTIQPPLSAAALMPLPTPIINSPQRRTKRPLAPTSDDVDDDDAYDGQSKRQIIPENTSIVDLTSDQSIKSDDSIFQKRPTKQYKYTSRTTTAAIAEETTRSLLSNTDTENA